MLYLALGLSYLCGAIPFGLIAGKLRGIDVRTAGSGNIGTTNVWRLLGPRVGAAVFVLDVLKGLAPLFIVGALMSTPSHLGTALGAVLAVLGHTFSVFLGFKGGKGVATGLGAVAGLAPLAALIGFAAWCLFVLALRMISAASILAVSVGFVAAWLTGAPVEHIVVVGLIAAIAILKHIPNMKRIAAGTEPKVTLFKSKAAA